VGKGSKRKNKRQLISQLAIQQASESKMEIRLGRGLWQRCNFLESNEPNLVNMSAF